MSGDGPWWVVIDLDRPYTGGEVLEPGRVRIPFATGESARRAAEAVRVSVYRDPEVIAGEILADGEVSGDFRRQADDFMTRNDELLRRLADLEAPAPKEPQLPFAEPGWHRVVQPVDRLQFLFGQAMLARWPVVHGDFVTGNARVT